MYIQSRSHTYTHAHTCTCKQTLRKMNTHTHTHSCTPKPAHTRVRTHTHTPLIDTKYIHTHITYTNIHTNVVIRTFTMSFKCLHSLSNQLLYGNEFCCCLLFAVSVAGTLTFP